MQRENQSSDEEDEDWNPLPIVDAPEEIEDEEEVAAVQIEFVPVPQADFPMYEEVMSRVGLFPLVSNDGEEKIRHLRLEIDNLIQEGLLDFTMSPIFGRTLHEISITLRFFFIQKLYGRDLAINVLVERAGGFQERSG